MYPKCTLRVRVQRQLRESAWGRTLFDALAKPAIVKQILKEPYHDAEQATRRPPFGYCKYSPGWGQRLGFVTRADPPFLSLPRGDVLLLNEGGVGACTHCGPEHFMRGRRN